MSLSASMWTSVSGLMTHGEKMNVVGNNIANVSTVGFKAQRADFSDFLYTSYGTTSGADQVGKGTGICALIGDFSQGAFENTNSATDLAINGNGFFRVRDEGRNTNYYTRAGDFYFNEKRELVNPNGLILQGWSLSQERSVSLGNGTANLNTSDEKFMRVGTPTDIVLDEWNSPPERTKNIKVANNLVNNDNYDKQTSATSPFTALFDTWNATKNPPLSDKAYATQSTIKTYDESGSPHDLTVYMDKVNDQNVDSSGNKQYEIEGLPAGYSVYEYLVTMDPAEDKRSYGGVYDPSTDKYTTDPTPFYDASGTIKQHAGVLMTGLLIFNSAGELVNQSAYTYGAQESPAYGTQISSTLDPDNKAAWQPTKISDNGLPVFTANFSGKALANSIGEIAVNDTTATTTNVKDEYLSSNNIIELDFGLRTSSSTPFINGSNSSTGNLGELEDSTSTAAPYAIDYANLHLMNSPVKDASATACNGTTFMTDIQGDGYEAGVLSNYSIDDAGVVYGYYSNGENKPLYQLAMYDFHSLQGLYREGGNLYSPTHDSGEAVEGVAGTGTFGKINSYFLENSNVDMSREFVHMISTQRGFQANSKSITTTDTMLETVIGMKR